jgi:hypothetical protein
MTIRRRGFLTMLGGLSAAIGAAPVLGAASDAAEPSPPAPPVPASFSVEYVSWPCIQCDTHTLTPRQIFDAVKFALTCTACGRRQPYLWHIKKFDPAPTEYRGTPGHALSRLVTVAPFTDGARRPTATSDPPTPPEARPVDLRSPRQRSMDYFRERYIRKHHGRRPLVV